MSDLISREEVLNLIDTAFESGAFDGRYAYENLIDAVQNLIHPLETDLVSRQAVIDTIETDCSWDMFNEWGARTPTGENIINAIKSVPSVEPEKCGDCISRKAAVEAIRDNDWMQAVFAIAHMPSVEPERKTGKWEYTTHYAKKYIVCSQCRAERIYDSSTGWNYCPNCGVKMKTEG